MPWMRMGWEADGLWVGLSSEIGCNVFFFHVSLCHRQTRQTTQHGPTLDRPSCLTHVAVVAKR